MKAGANKLDQVKIRRMMNEGKEIPAISRALLIDEKVVANFVEYFSKNEDSKLKESTRTGAVPGGIPTGTGTGAESQVKADESGAASTQPNPAK